MSTHKLLGLLREAGTTFSPVGLWLGRCFFVWGQLSLRKLSLAAESPTCVRLLS